MVGVGAATKSVKGQQRVSVELQLYGSVLSAMPPLNPKLIVFALLVACISHVAHGVDESPAAGVRGVPHPGVPTEMYTCTVYWGLASRCQLVHMARTASRSHATRSRSDG